MLDFITWTADPAIFSIGSREIRWYGLAFAIGFLIGLLSGESARNSEGLGGWTSQSWGNVGYNHRHLFLF